VVSVATTGGRVEMEEERVREVVAAVRAGLDNVAVHVGTQAPAWVLLEQGTDEVVVTVRDEGPGIPEGRLAEAEAEGRLGVTRSIVGRVEELGGTARLSTGALGTEWELCVPLAAPAG
jgi:signal transduction histidine kinase